jgi:hypothetical protein
VCGCCESPQKKKKDRKSTMTEVNLLLHYTKENKEISPSLFPAPRPVEVISRTQLTTKQRV